MYETDLSYADLSKMNLEPFIINDNKEEKKLKVCDKNLIKNRPCFAQKEMSFEFVVGKDFLNENPHTKNKLCVL